jgi:hypothetical protein
MALRKLIISKEVNILDVDACLHLAELLESCQLHRNK